MTDFREHCLLIVAAALVAICYMAYLTLTHGDGFALATVVGSIALIIGYGYGHRSSAIVKKE